MGAGSLTNTLVPVTDAGEAVFPRAVRLAPGEIVGEIIPGVAVGAVILADGAPGPLREVRAPPPPAGMVFRDFAETLVLAGQRGYGHDTILHYGWVPSNRGDEVPGHDGLVEAHGAPLSGGR